MTLGKWAVKEGTSQLNLTLYAKNIMPRELEFYLHCPLNNGFTDIDSTVLVRTKVLGVVCPLKAHPEVCGPDDEACTAISHDQRLNVQLNATDVDGYLIRPEFLQRAVVEVTASHHTNERSCEISGTLVYEEARAQYTTKLEPLPCAGQYHLVINVSGQDLPCASNSTLSVRCKDGFRTRDMHCTENEKKVRWHPQDWRISTKWRISPMGVTERNSGQ